jgi:hypothetical protein
MDVKNAENKSQHVVVLAQEILDDIELSRMHPVQIVLKATRLARITDNSDILKWLQYETRGFSNDEVGRRYMGLTGRWINADQNSGYWGSLAENLAAMESSQAKIQSINTSNIHWAPTSANPYERVTDGFTKIESHMRSLSIERTALGTFIQKVAGIRSKVLGLIHDFTSKVYYERKFSAVAESIFDKYKIQLDMRLQSISDDVLKKIPAVYERLGEGDEEAISQALNSCRRIIDTFADAIFPPQNETMEMDGNQVKLGSSNHLNRLNAYIRTRVTSTSRRTKFRQTLTNLYDRVSAGVHKDVTGEEAKALFIQTLVCLGEILSLSNPPPVPPQDAIQAGIEAPSV